MMLGYNVENIRENFPVLSKPIIYFDSACMSLKPKQVIAAILRYYEEFPACAGRSAHTFAKQVELEIAKARNEVKKLIHAQKDKEIIFTRNTTEGINLICNTLQLQKGDSVILTDKEHNSNLIPWLKKGIQVKIVPSNKDNTFNLEEFQNLFDKSVKLVSMVHVSNLDGVENPIKEISKIAHEHNAKVLVDGAQSVPSQEINVKKLGMDFLAFSGHKMLGPTGTGVLYGKEEELEKLDQFMVGCETVRDSTYTTYTKEFLPHRFEAGLQDYAGIMGLQEAARFLRRIGLKKIQKHEIMLNKVMTETLTHPSIELIGPVDPTLRSGIFSFNIKGMSPHEVSKILDTAKGIMTRSGAHCVHSWFNKHNLEGSCRASLYLYNTPQEVNIFCEEVQKLIHLT
ncbi:MAG: cysteine desulfurase [Candidatus Woesearchaeota archaeon]|nr:cysteine desulfurase [Candidatus Woesearchaeota archaeon]MDP7324264.1 cysteine desulfurase [Candidatus Woesearchaeota archaeon]